jgi:hypothetical protein
MNRLCWLAAMAVCLVGCAQPFDLTSNLGGKILTYNQTDTYGAVGMDTTTFKFNASGNAGEFEISTYSFGFATQAAMDSGAYADQSWYRTGGERGTFTYESSSFLLVRTTTEAFAKKPAASTSFAEDYAFESLKDSYGSGCSEASRVRSSLCLFTQDNMRSPAMARGDSWEYKAETHESQSISGVVHTYDYVYLYTNTVTAKKAESKADMTVTNKNGSDASTVQHTVMDWIYTVDRIYEIGRTTEGEDFEKLWKKGKTVCLDITQDSYRMIMYIGDTPPAEPIVDPITGIGSTGSMSSLPYYSLSYQKNGFGKYYFQHCGSYIIGGNFGAYAQRHVDEGVVK